MRLAPPKRARMEQNAQCCFRDCQAGANLLRATHVARVEMNDRTLARTKGINPSVLRVA